MASNSKENNPNQKVVETLIKTYEIQQGKLQKINKKIKAITSETREK